MFLVKTIVSALIIALVSEIAKRSSFWSALLISLPIVSILSFVWIYIESKDVAKIQQLSTEVFYLVIPSLLFFIALPFFIKLGMGFWAAIGFSIAVTAGAYLATTKALALWA